MRRIFSKGLSLDITMNILDDASMGNAVKFTRAYLQTLSTDALFGLADQYGLFLSSDLTRHLLIGELLDLDDGVANDEYGGASIATSKGLHEAAYSYNMTEIRVILKNPLWFFVFWDFHKRLFIDLTEAKDFAFFTNGREQILAQSNIIGMHRENIPQRLCISQNEVNKVINLSGLTSLKKSHFRHYRQAFR